MKKKILVEASGCHVHLSREALEALFGPDAKLIKRRALSQPGQFLCEQRIKLVTHNGVLDNVAVLGPVRPHTQVELSLTDCKKLGITAPINLSGNFYGAADVLLVGEKGEWKANKSVIVARNHIHITPKEALEYGVTENQKLRVLVQGTRSVIFEGVQVRINENSSTAMHIDYDEANSCGYGIGTEAFILYDSECAKTEAYPVPQELEATVRRLVEEILKDYGCRTVPACPGYNGKLITENIAKDMLLQLTGNTIVLKKGMLITPSAKDVFLHARIAIEYERK